MLSWIICIPLFVDKLVRGCVYKWLKSDFHLVHEQDSGNLMYIQNTYTNTVRYRTTIYLLFFPKNANEFLIERLTWQD